MTKQTFRRDSTFARLLAGITLINAAVFIPPLAFALPGAFRAYELCISLATLNSTKFSAMKGIEMKTRLMMTLLIALLPCIGCWQSESAPNEDEPSNGEIDRTANLPPRLSGLTSDEVAMLREILAKAAARAKQIEDELKRGVAMGAVAEAQAYCGLLDEAEETLQEWRGDEELTNSAVLRSLSVYQVAGGYAERGDFESAREFADRVGVNLDNSEMDNVRLLVETARSLLRQGNSDDAMKTLREARAITETTVFYRKPCLLSVIRGFAEAGDLSEAHRLAKLVSDDHGTGIGYAAIATGTAMTGDCERALSIYVDNGCLWDGALWTIVDESIRRGDLEVAVNCLPLFVLVEAQSIKMSETARALSEAGRTRQASAIFREIPMVYSQIPQSSFTFLANATAEYLVTYAEINGISTEQIDFSIRLANDLSDEFGSVPWCRLAEHAAGKGELERSEYFLELAIQQYEGGGHSFYTVWGELELPIYECGARLFGPVQLLQKIDELESHDRSCSLLISVARGSVDYFNGATTSSDTR